MKKFYAAISIVLAIIALIAVEPARAAGDMPCTVDYSDNGEFWKFTSPSDPPHLVSPVEGDLVKSLRPEFSWSSDPGAIQYRIQVSRTTDFSRILLDATALSNWYTPNIVLPAHSTLYWRVRMRNNSGFTDWSEISSLTTPNPPGIPILVSPAVNALVRSHLPLFDWTDSVLPRQSAPFSGYQIQVARDGKFSTIAIDEFTTPGNIQDSDFTPVEDLLPNTRYYWRVRAFNENGEHSSWSAVRSFRSAILPPRLTEPLHATLLDNKRPLLDWEDVSGAAGYIVSIYEAGNARHPIHSATVIQSRYVPPRDLPATTLLYWRVQATGPYGPSLWSESWSFTTGNPPSVPRLESPIPNALLRDFTPHFNWSNSSAPKNTAFMAYQIQVDNDRYFSSPEVDANTSFDDIADSGFAHSIDLASNTTFYWRVRAHNTNKEYSAWSNVWKFRTAILEPILTFPSKAAVLDNNRPTLDWADADGATGYQILISSHEDLTNPIRVVSKINSSYRPGFALPARTKFYWRVQATGPNGPSRWSETGSFTTGNPPSAPLLESPASGALVKDLTPRFDWSNSRLPTNTSFIRYNIQVDNDRNFSSPSLNDSTEQTVLADSDYAVADSSALAPNTQYFWRVQAVSSFQGNEQFSAWSSTWSFRTASSSPLTFTATSVPSCTATATHTQPLTSTNTPTQTATCPTPTSTWTSTPTLTHTSMPTSTATHTLTYTPTASSTPSRTPTQTPVVTFTPTDTPTFTPTNSPVITLPPTLTFTPTSTPTVTPTKTPVSTLTCSTPMGIGILGDSNSDEYRAEDARGGQYGPTTLNWMEQLVKNRAINFGKWGTWSEPRRTGYEYNWARSGATARTMITGGQVPGLAQQVAQGRVAYVLIWIGSNDFHLKNGPYAEIYNGTLSGAALESKLNGIVNDIRSTMDTIQSAGNVSIAIVTIGDQGRSPLAPALFPDPVKRQHVTDAIHSVNVRIRELAEARGIVVIDSNSIEDSLFTNVDERGYLHFGGRFIHTLEQGDDPYHMQLADNIGHAGTVLSGIFANSVFVDTFNREFGLCVPRLTDHEILTNAWIK